MRRLIIPIVAAVAVVLAIFTTGCSGDNKAAPGAGAVTTTSETPAATLNTVASEDGNISSIELTADSIDCGAVNALITGTEVTPEVLREVAQHISGDTIPAELNELADDLTEAKERWPEEDMFRYGTTPQTGGADAEDIAAFQQAFLGKFTAVGTAIQSVCPS